MVLAEIKVPQLGEGLQEVLIREFLKHPGQPVRRDEPIYVMETDKALVEAESPLEGTLQEWLVQVDDIVPIGGPVARILAQSPVSAPAHSQTDDAGGAWPVDAGTRPLTPAISPSTGEMEKTRTPTAPRCHAEGERTGVKGMAGGTVPMRPTVAQSSNYACSERPLSPQQKALLFRLSRSAQVVISGNVARRFDWRLRGLTTS
jgi:pyruvate dehydrogenase E2 component (dihydrolipoamide acetyltransferase)